MCFEAWKIKRPLVCCLARRHQLDGIYIANMEFGALLVMRMPLLSGD